MDGWSNKQINLETNRHTAERTVWIDRWTNKEIDRHIGWTVGQTDQQMHRQTQTDRETFTSGMWTIFYPCQLRSLCSKLVCFHFHFSSIFSKGGSTLGASHANFKLGWLSLTNTLAYCIT